MAVGRDHIGQLVTDGVRTGVLQEVIKDWEDPAALPGERPKITTAFVRSSGGGREWCAQPSRLSLARELPLPVVGNPGQVQQPEAGGKAARGPHARSSTTKG